MTAFWLLWHTAGVARGQPGWLPLAVCIVILAVKRVYWPPTLCVFAATAVLAAVVGGVLPKTGKLPKWRQMRWCGAALLWLAWGSAAFEWHAAAHSSRAVELHPAKTVVCIGNSLTSGVRPYGGYPDDLDRRLTVPVVNLGQPGITAEEALDLLPKLRQAKPQAVVIELGGHDFLKGRDRGTTKSHLERLVDAAREADAVVILMEIPRGFMVDPFAGLEREIAREHDLELVSDTAIRNLVLWSPHAPPGMWIGEPYLSDDGLHPNSNGNRHLAEHVAKALARMYGEEIRAIED